MIDVPADAGDKVINAARRALAEIKDEIAWRGVTVDLRSPELADGQWHAASLVVAPDPSGAAALFVSWAATRNQAWGGPRHCVELADGDTLSVAKCKIELVGDADAPGDALALDWDRLRARLCLRVTKLDGTFRDVPDILTLTHPLMMREVQTSRDPAVFTDDLAGREHELYNTDLNLASIPLMHRRLEALVGRTDLHKPGAFDGGPRSAQTANYHYAQALAFLEEAGSFLKREFPGAADKFEHFWNGILQATNQAAAFGYMQMQCEFEAGPRAAAIYGKSQRSLRDAAAAAARKATRREWPERAIKAWIANPDWTINKVAEFVMQQGDDKAAVIRALRPYCPASSPSYTQVQATLAKGAAGKRAQRANRPKAHEV